MANDFVPDTIRAALLPAHELQLPVSPREAFRQVATQGTLPDWLNVSELAHFLESADGAVQMVRASLDERARSYQKIIFNFTLGRFRLGSVKTEFLTSGEVPLAVGARTLITMGDNPAQRGHYYGFEIFTNMMRYAYWHDGLDNFHLNAVDDGRFAWRYLDGFRIPTRNMRRISNQIGSWQNQYGWNPRTIIFPQPHTPYQAIHAVNLDRPEPDLMEVAKLVWHYPGVHRSYLEKKTTLPGELLLLKNGSYQGTLNTSEGSMGYEALLASLVEFWVNRTGATPRVPAIVQDLEAEQTVLREIRLADIKDTVQPDGISRRGSHQSRDSTTLLKAARMTKVSRLRGFQSRIAQRGVAL